MEKALHELSVSETGASLRSGRTTAVALAEHALHRIARLEPVIHSFIRVTADRALRDAERADRELASGMDRGPMHGIPYGLKDIFDTDGIPTTCNSKLFLHRVPVGDAAIETKLKAAGAVLLGKLNTHEFALGGPSFDLPFEPARNPWNPDHFTGGSSSGSGAAVGAGLMRIAFGTDTGGSIRSPACHCGVVGVKPTYGLVSRRGAYPLSYSLDHCGTLAWTVAEAAIALNTIAGFDPLDPSSVDVPIPDFTEQIGQDIHGLRIGYARGLFAGMSGVSSEVVSSVDHAAEVLTQLGAAVDEIELPDFDLFKACGRLIMIAEAYAIHEENLKTRPLDYGRYTYERMIPGASLSAADLTQAFRLRRELTRIVTKEALAHHDALLTATGLAPAARLDEFPPGWPPPARAVAVQTVPFNVTGTPVLALPSGFSESGLPLGIQIAGRPFDESTLFRIGAAFEGAAGVREKRPALWDTVEPVR